MSSHQIPDGIADDALVGYLNTATLCTTNLEEYKHFYGEVMMMQMEGPLPISKKEKELQRLFWHIPNDIEYDLYHCYRASVPSLIHLRIIHLKQPTPKIHRSYNSYELGSFSLGFPTSNAEAMDERMMAYNVTSMAPTQIGDIIRANGVPGQYIETIYKGPDFLHCVGIERVNISQLAPCDPDNGFGGPGYSALVAKNAEAEIGFYTRVLDHYTQLDEIWKTAEGSALGTGPGVPYRFTSFYAKGALQNHVIMLEFQNGKAIDTGVPSQIPNQGLGMYSFYTKDIREVIQRAENEHIEILSSPQQISDNILGNGTACLLKAPSGMYIEIMQTK